MVKMTKTMTFSEFRQRWIKTMQGISNDFTNVLVETAPVDTGNLKNQIQVDIREDGSGTISMPEYGKFVEFGTPPHIIRPKNKKALSWDGLEHPVKIVHHPGTRPQPFIRNAIQTHLKDIIVKNLRRQFA